MPSDEQIQRKIEQLEQEREGLRHDESTAREPVTDAARHLEEIRVELDQLWDLKRQRQALHDAGRDPNEAQERSRQTVEGYWQ